MTDTYRHYELETNPLNVLPIVHAVNEAIKELSENQPASYARYIPLKKDSDECLYLLLSVCSTLPGGVGASNRGRAPACNLINTKRRLLAEYTHGDITAEEKDELLALLVSENES